ncbi:hypothetical protein OCF84_20565 (plasmid) [Shewanella xiamenensis]|uniref:Uncharacterized protein n=1 Tax=Shewanella xiamenensis TaxID=332186 RepID=A0ABT6UH81_9GAMM|nr:hypothetical protein [Shewanella xiamenensis]MDI5833337.1 hypothetical protein [Shewanella xiamenensis]WHF57911.1 hypothetical protein OCF84_20565 [Shewanella xiamenensis]
MSSYRAFLQNVDHNDVKSIILHISPYASLDMNSGDLDSILDLVFSKSLNLATTTATTAERFNTVLKLLNVNSNQYASKFKLDRGFAKRITYISNHNPSVKKLSSWLSSPICASALIYVFFPKAHNRMLFTIQ